MYNQKYPEFGKENELLTLIPSIGSRVSNVLISEIYKDENGQYNSKKLALIAVARKLLVIACAILNSHQPYDSNHISYQKANIVPNSLKKVVAKLA